MSDYPPGMTLRPIDAWPRPEARKRVRSPFTATWRSTLDLLDRELHYLGKDGRRAPSVLQIAMRERDFRVTDGLPRADARPAHPGVILSVESNKGPLTMPCDKFDHWQDNLRAIALSLEALRKVDRYGTTPGNEQYRGWQPIEAGSSSRPMSPEEALKFLGRLAGVPDAQRADAATIYRAAARATHPDRNGGDRTVWNEVERAASALRNEGWL